MSRRAKWIAAAIAAVVLVVGLGTAFMLLRPSDEGGLGPSATSIPSPGAADGSDDEDGGPEASDGVEDDVAARVPADDPDSVAEFGGGVAASVVTVSSIDAEAKGVGETSGPALAFTMVITNDSDEAVDVSAVTVNLDYGSDAKPAAPLFSEPSASEFTGSIAPGASATASYVFSIPKSEQGSFHLSLSYSAGSPTVVFER